MKRFFFHLFLLSTLTFSTAQEPICQRSIDELLELSIEELSEVQVTSYEKSLPKLEIVQANMATIPWEDLKDHLCVTLENFLKKYPGGLLLIITHQSD